MRISQTQVVHTDVLIIGGGGAGLKAAIEARERGARTTIVSLSRVGYGSNTAISGAGFAVASSTGRRGDSPESHLRDTVAGGYYVNDPSLVEIMVRDAERQRDALERFGADYATGRSSPWIKLSFNPGHSRDRLVYCRTPLGTDLTLPLRRYAMLNGVEFVEGLLVTRLLKHRESVVGAVCLDAHGGITAIAAPATVLSTGGAGQAYSRTDNTAGSTGDGYALAYEAGAILQDMEFVQFYPVSLGMGSPAVFYECLLRETGGRLVNSVGEDIVSKYGLDDRMLLTRDRLSQAIASEIESGLAPEGKAVLDLSEVPPEKIEALRPVLPKAARRGERCLPVAPTAHFIMGGVRIDERTRTSVPGLYAAGEVTAGIHGANRLSGNALTELWVFGTIAGREAAADAEEANRKRFPEEAVAAEAQRLAALREQGTPVEELRRRLKEIMWEEAGVVRNGKGLEGTIDTLSELQEPARRISVAGPRDLREALKLTNTLKVSEMICRAALYRCESRGAHYRSDQPEQDDERWLRNVLIAADGERMLLTTEPVSSSRSRSASTPASSSRSNWSDGGCCRG
jgi:fumarate reductase (CoM/CoB) subunit A